MVRRDLTWAAVVVATLFGAATARGEEDMRTAPQFLQGLRERGYYDLADQLLETLRTAPGTPEAFRQTIDYEQGRLMIDEASRTGDLGLRKEQLDKARAKLVTFTQKNPNHALVAESLVQLARLLVERGHLAMVQVAETDDPKLKEAKLVEARGSFDQAREAYPVSYTHLTLPTKA